MKKKIIIVVVLLLLLACVGGVVAVKVIERNKTLALIEEVKSLVVAELVEEVGGDDISADDISIEVKMLSYNSKRNDYYLSYTARLEENGKYDEADKYLDESYLIRSQIEAPSGFDDCAYVDMDTKIVGLLEVAECLARNYNYAKENYSSLPALVEATQNNYLEYAENKINQDGLDEYLNNDGSWEILVLPYLEK